MLPADVDNSAYIPLGRQKVLQGPSARPPSVSLPKSAAETLDLADALPALLTASKESFGDVKVLFCSTERVAGRRGRFTSRLTVAVPDGPRQAFPRSPVCSSAFDAKVRAVILAVQEGALDYLAQWLPPRTFGADLGEPEPIKRDPLILDLEDPHQTFNAALRRLGERAAESWVVGRLEDVVLTVELPSGRRSYGSLWTNGGRNATEAKKMCLKKALKAGLFATLVVELDTLGL